MTENNQPSDLMTCMEVLGGNNIADQALTMMGLNAWIYAKPYGGSTYGGDVYYLSSCATGRIIRLLIADISGHGDSATKPAEKLRYLMRRYINQINQMHFVKAMNTAFSDFSSQGVFATAIAATYFAPTQTLTITNAGHPKALHFEKSTKKWGFLMKKFTDKSTVNEQSPANIPLGILDISEYDTRSLRLKMGDIVLIFTDSLTESKTVDGKMLGCQGIIDILNQQVNLKVNSDEIKNIIPKLITTISSLNPDNLNDDTTVMMFSPNTLFASKYTKPNLREHIQLINKMMAKAFAKDQPFPWPDLHPANLGGAMFNFMNKLWGRKLK